MRRRVATGLVAILLAGFAVAAVKATGCGSSEESAAPVDDDQSDPVAVSVESETPESDREHSERESVEARSVSENLDKPGQQKDRERREYDPAVLKVVTNFDKADVTVNGLPYPEYQQEGEQDGMVLPAGGPYTVQVKYGDKTKTYTITLEPYRQRILMVELSGYKGKSIESASSNDGRNPSRQRRKKDDDEGDTGRLTVYGKPKGTIIVDGDPKDQQTPGTISVEAGQHEVQVKFEDGEMSESKSVRVREGSQIKLFFRRDD